MIIKDKIAILSTVINFDLYARTSPLFPRGIRSFVIDGRNGMHGIESICYMMEVLPLDIEWLIMADEDVVFLNREAVYPIIEKMQESGALFSGVRDGGLIAHRDKNPWAINTFFSILHLSEVRKIWNKREMLSNQYVVANEFDDDLSQLPSAYNIESIFEPYYCFYLWLRRKSGKVLFLNSIPKVGDEIANTVFGLDNNPMLHHTWYSRSYGINEKHTKRINKILAEIPEQKSAAQKPIVFKDKSYAFKKYIKKFFRKVLRKLKLSK